MTRSRSPVDTFDRAGMLLVGLAIATAPLEIWALARVGSHGVTAAHLVAILACGFAVLRFRRMSLTPAFVLYSLLALLAWGVAVAFLLGGDSPSLTRTLRNASLFVLVFGAFAGGSTIRLDWTGDGAGPKIGALGYTLIVLYAIYQAIARRLQWPLAFLPVTNPTYKSDPFQPGVQYGISAVARGYGEYFMRASATFSEPSYLGQYLVYGLIIGLALLPLRGRHARLGMVSIVLATAGLIANYSLTGLLAFAVAGVVLTVPLMLQVRFSNLLRTGAAIGVIVLIALQLYPAIFQNVAHRLSNLSIENSSRRFEALPMIGDGLRQRPWGAGLSLVPFDNDIYSGVVLLALQFGIVGFLPPLLWAVAVVTGMTILVIRSRTLSPSSRAALTASTGFLAVQLAGWFASGEMRHALAWIMAGVAFGTLGRIIEHPIRIRAREELEPLAAS